MKGILLAGLSVLMMSVSAPAAFAETHIAQKDATAQPTVDSRAARQLSPKELVTMAERGASDRGIPSHGRLADAAASRRITAPDLVKAAIAAEQLSPEALNDTRYLNAVANFLASLNRG